MMDSQQIPLEAGKAAYPTAFPPTNSKGISTGGYVDLNTRQSVFRQKVKRI